MGRKGKARNRSRAEQTGPTKFEQELSARIALARRGLLALYQRCAAGDPEITRLRPALQAEILGLESEYFAEQADRATTLGLDTSKSWKKGEREAVLEQGHVLRKRARQALADSIKCQAEARRALELALVAEVEEIKRALSERHGLAEEIHSA